MTAMLEVEALFAIADGQLRGMARDPDLILSLRCGLARVLDLTVDNFYRELDTTRDELVSLTPSRFIANLPALYIDQSRPTVTHDLACAKLQALLHH